MTVRNRLTSLPRLWFSFRMPVHRLEYAASGLVLTPFKFLIDSWLFGQDSGGTWTITSYLQPVFSNRFGELANYTVWRSSSAPRS